MQADMVGDFLLRVSVLSLSNAKIKDLTLLFLLFHSYRSNYLQVVEIGFIHPNIS
jgi:hypothetical protein